MLMWLFAVALGAPTLLHGTDEAPARRRVWVDLRTLDVELRTPADLVREPEPYLVRATVQTPCKGPASTNYDVLRILSDADELRMAMRADDAWAEVDRAKAVWACLNEPADAIVGERLHFLAGIAAHYRGDASGAIAAFRDALRYNPSLAWNDDFAPDARPAFLSAQQSIETPITVTLVPQTAAIALRVDGRSLVPRDGVLEIPAGFHLIQLADGPTFWADLKANDWLVVPDQLTDDLLKAVSEEAGRNRLTGLLYDAPVQRPVYVPDRRTTWAWDGNWTEHRPPLFRRMARPLIVTGAVAFLGGVAWMAIESTQAQARQAEPFDPDLDTPGHQALINDHQANQIRWGTALGVATLGGLTLAGGSIALVVTW